MNQSEVLEAEKYQSMLVAISRRAQEDFRRIYLDPQSGARRIKITKDEKWIEAHGTNEVDLASLDYQGLPADWQSERKIGAQIALDAVLDAVTKDESLDASFIEKTAELLHDKWLERNSTRATEIEKRQYESLPENEKEKDRFFARAAVETYHAMGS